MNIELYHLQRRGEVAVVLAETEEEALFIVDRLLGWKPEEIDRMSEQEIDGTGLVLLGRRSTR